MVDSSLMISEPTTPHKHWGRRVGIIAILLAAGGMIFLITRPRPQTAAAVTTPVVTAPAQTPPQFQDHLDDALYELQQVDQ